MEIFFCICNVFSKDSRLLNCCATPTPWEDYIKVITQYNSKELFTEWWNLSTEGMMGNRHTPHSGELLSK